MSQFDDEWALMLEALEWLGAQGYRRDDIRGPKGMEQGVVDCSGSRLEIRLLADRGQWFVKVEPSYTPGGPRKTRSWFNLEAWSLCLGAAQVFHDDQPFSLDHGPSRNSWRLAPQLDYLRAHLADIPGSSPTGKISSPADFGPTR